MKGWTKFFPTNHPPLFSPGTEETQCEAPFAFTISDALLTDLYLVRLIPIMISRMMISLKKAARSRQPHLDLEIPTGTSTNFQHSHSGHQAVDAIPLSVFTSERT